MNLAFLLSLWLIPIAANVYMDRNGRKPNYLAMFCARGFFAIVHAILFNPHNFFDWWPILLFQVTSFWILFELALNIVRKKPLLYFDTVEHDSGLIDRVFSKLGITFHAFAKVLCFAVMVLSIAVLYHRQ